MHSQSKVNMPPSMSMPDPATSQLPLDAAYAATLPAMAALPTTELLAVNVDLMSAVTTVIAALPALRALRPQIARQLPAFDLQHFDQLEQYARALAHVHATFRGTSPQRGNISALAAELSKLRDRLLSAAQCLVAHELMDARRLKDCKRARGYRALASDLLMLLALFKEHRSQIEGRTPVTTTMLQQAATGAFRLIRAMGEKRAPAMTSEAQLARQRAFTLLFHAYADARRAVEYLRHLERDAASIAPALYVGRAGRGATMRRRRVVLERADAEVAVGRQRVLYAQPEAERAAFLCDSRAAHTSCETPKAMRAGIATLIILSSSFSESPARAFEKDGHRAATHDALPGVNSRALCVIDGANAAQDSIWSLSFGRDAHHFNDCGFAVAAAYIREQYRSLDESLAAGDSEPAQEALGRILHAAQDFYSHSNWVDSELTGLVTDAADAQTRAIDWPALPSGELGGVVIVGSGLEGWHLTRTGRTVTARSSAGVDKPAVITGAVAVSTACPLSVVVGHWDSCGESGGLAKDDATRPNHERALAVAQRQSRREICRVLDRVAGRGQAANREGLVCRRQIQRAECAL
ncbi:MAG: hypothetical protein RL685_1937 [Pseudomonadota bacterium]|jgi:hypothetical protein